MAHSLRQVHAEAGASDSSKDGEFSCRGTCEGFKESETQHVLDDAELNQLQQKLSLRVAKLGNTHDDIERDTYGCTRSQSLGRLEGMMQEQERGWRESLAACNQQHEADTEKLELELQELQECKETMRTELISVQMQLETSLRSQAFSESTTKTLEERNHILQDTCDDLREVRLECEYRQAEQEEAVSLLSQLRFLYERTLSELQQVKSELETSDKETIGRHGAGEIDIQKDREVERLQQGDKMREDEKKRQVERGRERKGEWDKERESLHNEVAKLNEELRCCIEKNLVLSCQVDIFEARASTREGEPSRTIQASHFSRALQAPGPLAPAAIALSQAEADLVELQLLLESP